MNVRAGVAAANALILAGFVAYCPMIDFQFFLSLYPGEEISEKVIRECAVSFVEHWAEAVLVLPGWEESKGVRGEVTAAIKCQIPVFYDEMGITKHFEAYDLIYKHRGEGNVTWEEVKSKGSEHYKTGAIEPVDLYKSAGMLRHFALSSIIKYAFRNADIYRPISISDLEKIKHYADILIAAFGLQKKTYEYGGFVGLRERP
jgi:hypothetical protein